MKKRILIIATLVITLMCALAITASAEAYTYDFGEVERIDYFENYEEENGKHYIYTVMGDAFVTEASKEARAVVSCSCEKGSHTYPTYYVMQERKSDWLDLFRRDFTTLNTYNPCGATYDKYSLLAIEVPEGIADFWGQENVSGVFMGCTSLVYASIPNTMESMHVNVFRGCSALEWVNFNNNNKITSLENSSFNGCSSLKGICLPDSITVMKNATFIGCVNLGPVHLPANLTSFGTSTQWSTFQGGENGNGTKYTKMFLTNERFDNPNEVTKPEVYYMPSKFASCGDQLFRGCSNINNIIVFPSTYSSVNDNRCFLDYGATAENPKIVVFLGDMTSFKAYADSSTSYMNYVFANANDIVDGFTYSFTSSGGVDIAIYSCASEKVFTPGASEWSSEGFVHFAEPKTITLASEPNCTENKKISANCFCGDNMGISDVEGTALGHSHTIFAGLVYLDFSKDGYYSYKCERCDSLNNDKTSPALFICLGYSAPENGDGAVAIGYTANYDAIGEYEKATGKTLTFGLFATTKERLGENDIVNSEGKVANGVVMAEISNDKFVSFEIKLVGLDNYKEKKFAIGAYVATEADGVKEYSYLQLGTSAENEKYYFASYNEIYAIVNPTV